MECADCEHDSRLDNPAEFAEELLDEECEKCPKGKPVKNPALTKLVRYMALLDADCPVERHELSETEWELIARLRVEEMLIISEKNKADKVNAETEAEDKAWQV